jgi:5-methylcytosine-specific restriction endonuclease McrA
MSLPSQHSDEQVKQFLSESFTLWEYCQKLGYTDKSNQTYRIVKKDLERRGISLQDYPVIARRLGTTKEKTNEEIFQEGVYYDTRATKKRLLKLGIPEVCSECGTTSMWNGKPLSLQVDHINGVNNDNRLENLRLLCPNCHSQTDTWGFKRRQK